MEDASVLESNENKKQLPFFSDVTDTNKLVFKHQENDFDDFKYQILLPHKLSQFGPALAVDDVNGDNLEDVFVGGAAGFPGQLFIQNSNGNFEKHPLEAFDKDRYSEDLDAIFLDIDNDGDKDLYVVSGGNEYEKGDENYMDRLYINDGNGNFSKSTNSLNSKSVSGSVVVTADFDGDGDLDVFVGGRLSPRDYPSPTDSQLLENKNGTLVDITKKKASELLDIGMVTDAIWSDYDNDKDLDLIIVGEWMPITVFKNEDGNFVKQDISSLVNSEGWWFSIEQGDFDNDGDMDFVAGNLGLNYKYKASQSAPFDVYYNDFDANGSKDIVLGYYQKNKHYPVRGFSCSSQQIPELKHDIKKYDVFASLEIKDIYGDKKLDNALYYKAQTFASSYIENLGNGEFKISELSIEPQFSNINDMLVEDFNSDGNLDVILVGNLFVSEIETTRNDAGIGLLMQGDGKGNFLPKRAIETGLFINKDAKKIRKFKNGNNEFILVANNNDKLQIIKIDKEKRD
jgi:enediyne biosynthesis protein E4